jgi:hypothetical protein
MMEIEPPFPGCNEEGSDVEVTPHPVNRLTPRRLIMRTILLEILLTAGFSSLPSKRRVI